MYKKVNSNKCEKCLFKNLTFGEGTNIFINAVKDERKGPNYTWVKLLPKDIFALNILLFNCNE